MNRVRFLPALVAACLATAISCKDKPSPEALIAQAGTPPDSFRVAFETSRGRIVVEVTRAWAPLGADRFFELVSSEFFDEQRFYRVVPRFIAQFGANDDKQINAWWDAKRILDDPVHARNVRGTIAYAKDKPNSRSHQLYINLSDNTRLDTMGFAPFGRVVEGMSVADSIYSGYGEKPDYHLLSLQGNNYLRRMFPKLDYIKTARVVPPMKVLFVGNSFTARNDVPGLIGHLAAARGHAWESRLISAGGASLRQHWNKGDAQKAMAATRYDFVMLQEQSTLPVKNAARMHENIRLFDGAIRESGARMALYLTWARRHTPEAQQVITDAYQSIGRELGAVVAPVGVAWQRFMASHTEPVLHDKDQSHPTLAGSYLSGCVIFATLFGESPVGVEHGLKGLSTDDVVALQGTAWAVVGQESL